MGLFKIQNSKLKIKTSFCLAVVLMFGVLSISPVQAFQGPTAGQNPGAGGGAFSLDPTGNVGFGTYNISGTLGTNYNTPPYGTFKNVFMIAATSTPPGIALRNVGSGGSGTYGYGLMDATWVWQLTPWGAITLSNAGSSFNYNRNAMTVFPDNRVVFPGPFGSGTNWFYPTSTLNVIGDATISNNVIALAFSGNASNVSGVIASNVGGGAFQSANYAFPLSLGVGTSTTSNLPQTLTVQGGGYFSGNVGIGTTGPGAKLHVSGGNILLDNGYYMQGKRYDGIANNLIGYASGTDNIEIGSYTSYPNSLIIYSPTDAGQGVSISGASTIAFFRNDGNVGIGTTSPVNKLDVEGGAVIGATYSGTNTAPSNGLLIEGNVGIGTTAPGAKLDVYQTGGGSGTNNALLLEAGNNSNYFGNNQIVFGYDRSGISYAGAIKSRHNSGADTGNAIDFYTWDYGTDAVGTVGTKHGLTIEAGNVGIGTTGPGEKLHVESDTDAAIRVLDTSGDTKAEVNIGSGEYWNLVSNPTTGTNAYGFEIQKNGAAKLVVDTNGNVGIATTTPAYTLSVNGDATFNGNTIHGVHSPSADTDAANKSYVDSAITSAVGGTSTSTGAYVLKTGDAMSGNLNMGGNNITGVNKLYVTTIDPVYQIQGVKYATYVSSVAGGVKEEYVGNAKLKNQKSKYEYVIDFNNIERGSDLWVWRNAVDFSIENVQVFATPIGVPVPIAYDIRGNEIIFKTGSLGVDQSLPTSIDFSFRLIGKRFDWQSWPTILSNQSQVPNLIVK